MSDSTSNDFPSLNGSSSTASPAVPSSSRPSAAQILQQAHAAQANGSTSHAEAEGSSSNGYAVDPFPVAQVAEQEAAVATPTPKRAVDISDESAFPSLGATSKKAGSGPTWGSGGGSAASRVKQQLAVPSPSNGASRATSTNGDDSSTSSPSSKSASVFTATVQLPTSDIHVHPLASANRGPKGSSASREAEPSTLGEVMKLLMRKYPSATVEASTSRQITTFIIKSKGNTAEAEVQKVKRELLGRLAKKVEISLKVPAGLRAFIIGAKGRTLKEITDATGASVQIPPREEDVAASESDSPDGPLIALYISGDSSAVALARAKILSIVSEKAAKVSTKVDVPKEFWAHLKSDALIESLGLAGAVSIAVPRADETRGILASHGEEKKEVKEEKVVLVVGEREAVAKAVAAINAEVAELKRSAKTITVSITKSQHRFLVGKNADKILAETGCSVDLPPADGSDENVTVRGPQSELIKALSVVMEVAASTPIEALDLLNAHRGNHDAKLYSSHLTRYVLRKSKFRKLSEEHSVQVYLPRASSIQAGTPYIEIVGQDAAAIAAAKKDIITIVRALPPTNFTVVEVDSLNHRHLSGGKNGKQIKALEEQKNVEVLFPAEGDDRSDILLVYSGEGVPTQALADATAEITALAKEAADIKTVTLTIPHKLHKHITGPNGTTLNAIIGEEKLSFVSFGAKGDDTVTVRGPEGDLERVSKEVKRVVEEAKDNEVANSHVIEFEVDTLQVRHVVGKAGSGINKLREDLGVQVDFEELPVASTSGAKKAGVARSKVTIKGRKVNAEEARRRITSTVEKMADEVTLTIPLPATLERGSIIGKAGTYLIRLETNYDVKINFPKAGKKADGVVEKSEIVIRGGKKGAEAARKELVDLMDYEKENGNVVSFPVVAKALPRILGKAGASINAIKEETGVNSIDVDQEDDSETANIILKGTKKGTAAAKALILAIAKEVEDEARLTIEIPRAYHTTLIGSGGSSIRDLIAKAGGPTDARGSGNAVRFPKQGDSLNTVTIVATKSVAEKIRAALEKEVNALESRVTYGVSVPKSQHASIIGKGASALQELQRKFGVKIVVPGWNEYEAAGEVVNAEDVEGGEAQDLIKILGPREAAAACATQLSANRPANAGPSATLTVMVPRKAHARIAQGGRFFRSLPPSTRITHAGEKPPSNSVPKPKKPSTNGASTSRIDDDDAGQEEAGEKIDFQLVEIYDGAAMADGDVEIPWVITASSQEDAERAAKDIEQALKSALSATHVAWITVPSGFMARVVGRGGAGLDKLRSVGVEVEVVGKRDSNQLTLTGTPEAIDAAHSMILELAAPRPRQQYNNREDY